MPRIGSRARGPEGPGAWRCSRRPFGCAGLGLNRQERGQGELSAIEEVEKEYGIPVISIITLDDIVTYLEAEADLENLEAIRAYREQYGI